MMKCPLVHICTYFVLGMLISDGLAGIIHPGKYILLVVLCLFLGFFVFAHFKALKLTAYVSMALFFMFVGWTYFSFVHDGVRWSVPEEGRPVVGCVVEQPVRKPKTWAVKVKASTGTKLQLYLKTEKPPAIGDTLSFLPLKVSKTCPLDVEDKEFLTYMRHLFYKGISATVYTDSSSCHILPSSSLSLSNYSEKVRLNISEIYKEGGVVGDEGAVVEAFTIGNRTGLTDSLKEGYSGAGVSHILALSGYHLSLIYALLEVLFLGRFVALRWRWVSRLCVLSSLWAFTWLAGMPPSLLRAAIMISVMIVSGISNRDALSLNSLALSAIIMLAADPLYLFDVGFQLSYSSMIGILVVGVPVTRKLSGIHWLADRILPVIVITVACSVFTAPLVAYYFGQVPLLSVITNLLLALIVPVVFFLAFLWWATIFFVPVQQVVTSVLLFVISVMNGVVGFVASITWGTVEWHPNLLGITLFYILLCSIIGIFHYLCIFKPEI